MQNPESNFNFIPLSDQTTPENTNKQPELATWQKVLRVTVSVFAIVVIIALCIVALGYSVGWAIKAVTWAISQL